MERVHPQNPGYNLIIHNFIDLRNIPFAAISYFIKLVMDQYSRSIIGFSINQGPVSGMDLCRMFNEVIADKSPPKRLSHDNDPLFLYEQWQRNIRIYQIEEVRSVPFCPTSHPFCERLIGTVRREMLDRTLFWNQVDLQRKLDEYKTYYNEARVHSGVGGRKPGEVYRGEQPTTSPAASLTWKKFCGGLFKVPEAA